MSNWFSAVLNVAAAIAQVILSLSPAPDIYNVHRRRDVDEMAALPLVAMAVNNHVWMLYGYLTDNLFPLSATQAFSQFAAIIYSVIYFRWSSELKRKELVKLLSRAFALHCALSLYFVLGVVGVTDQTNPEVGTRFGYVGHVVKTKDSTSIPINLSVMLLISTLLWLGTGILDSDLFIAGINSVGRYLQHITRYLNVQTNDISAGLSVRRCHSTFHSLLLTTLSAFATMSIWVDILNVVTAVAQVILSLSLTPDLYNVHRRKSTGEMVALPLVAMAVNNHAWMLYGYLADNMFPIFATQAFSQTAALIYNIVFFRYTVPEKRNALYKLYSRAFAVHCAFSIYTILGVAGVTNQTKGQVGDWVGYAAIVINIWMYASPLGTLKHVIATKNAASIPINLSVMIFVSASLWLASGIVDDDFFVWGINAIGTMLSFIQIVVYYIFRPTQQQDEMKDGDLTVVIDNATTTATVESPAYKPMPSPVMTMKK
ncbi:hypothetical protein JG688_00014414 [Phytophthora aleatoria]|uniref:Sugar transporter SWEET1 n=1 Tax=Phytophthora aleatoria TaxID=2496075 RepID=A0A8J5MDZ5_9STRA|nr:hypothetical protein JG688_00014414 [Phytophthora aleatoria]